MKILALDTAGWKCSVALWEDGQELAFQEKSSERDQAAILPQLVSEVKGQHTIDQLLVNIGPGSFTGIRVGLAFAKGLAKGWGLPLKGVDGFIATYVSLGSPKDLLVLVEARRQDVYGRRFQNGIPQLPQNFTRAEIETILLLPPPPPLAGSGIHPFLEGLIFKEMPSPWQGAQALAYTFFKDTSLITCDPLPFYVREADVTLS
jgi:tRNA threonylcarbamoyladenosine biosynthesis protein TsaB